MQYAALAQLLASLVGEGMSAIDKEKQKKVIQDALSRIQGIQLPDLQDVSAEELQGTAGNVVADPALKAAQLEILGKLKEGQTGGLSFGEQANLNRMQNQSAQRESGQRAAILQQMAARGVGGSGAELAAQLGAQQAGAQRAQEAGLDTAAMSQKRYLQSLMGRGEMAGQMRGQQFGEEMHAAKAKDYIQEYNNRSRERAKMYRAGLPQQNFENKLRREGAGAGMEGALSSLHGSNAADTRQRVAGYGAAGGQALQNMLDKDDEDKKYKSYEI